MAKNWDKKGGDLFFLNYIENEMEIKTKWEKISFPEPYIIFILKSATGRVTYITFPQKHCEKTQLEMARPVFTANSFLHCRVKLLCKFKSSYPSPYCYLCKGVELSANLKDPTCHLLSIHLEIIRHLNS